MRLRPATAEDIPALVDLWQQTGLLSGRDDPSQEIAVKLQRDADLFLVAEEGGTLVASAMGAYDGRSGWIHRVAVAPARRGQGIGRALVSDLERRFAQRGISRLRLLVRTSNDDAKGFWRQLGYERLPQIEYYRKDLPP